MSSRLIVPLDLVSLLSILHCKAEDDVEERVFLRQQDHSRQNREAEVAFSLPMLHLICLFA